MLSHALYRWARFAARRPLAMIGSWLVVSVLVIGASGAFGQDLQDSFEVPGLDSQEAADLLTAARSDQVGLTAQVVLTPRDERASFFDDADARGRLLRDVKPTCPRCSTPPTRRGRRPPDPRQRRAARSRPTVGSPASLSSTRCSRT